MTLQSCWVAWFNEKYLPNDWLHGQSPNRLACIEGTVVLIYLVNATFNSYLNRIRPCDNNEFTFFLEDMRTSPAVFVFKNNQFLFWRVFYVISWKKRFSSPLFTFDEFDILYLFCCYPCHNIWSHSIILNQYVHSKM